MPKPQNISICRLQPCNDPRLEAFVGWDQDDNAFLLVELEGLPLRLDAATIVVQSSSNPEASKPSIKDEVYLYDDLIFCADEAQKASQILYRREWYWAFPGTVKSYEDDLTLSERAEIAFSNYFASANKSDAELTELITLYGVKEYESSRHSVFSRTV